MPETIPIACSLDQAELPDRASIMESLGKRLVAVEAEGLGATLRFEVDSGRIEEFLQVESVCCPFFEFEITEAADATTLHIRAPEGAEWAVRGLVAGFVAGWSGLV